MLMHPLRKQPLLEFLILLAGMISIMLLIQGANTWIALSTTKQAPTVAQNVRSELDDLQRVAATGKCPYSASVSMGQTAGGKEMRTNPTSDPKVYDPFPPNYKNVSKGTRPPGTALASGQKDNKLPIIGTIFGYKPSNANYYEVLENNNAVLTGTTWTQYLLGVPTEIGAEIKAPQTGYDIGGGKIGLVVYATPDQVTIHIGRHEYLTGNGVAESGGYWIYLKGLCVNSEIVSKYKANAGSRTQLPELSKGELLGYATGTEVLLAVRDNGPFQDILGAEWWGGVSNKDVSTSTPAGSTNIAPAAPATNSNGTTSTTTSPGPAVSLSTIKNSINLNIQTIDEVKKIVSQGGSARQKILLIGDSNTANKNFRLVADQNATSNIDEDKVANGGWKVSDAYKALNGKLSEMTKYKYALILIGTGDTEDPFLIKDFSKQLGQIVELLLSHNIVPILQTIAEFRQEGDGGNSRIAKAQKINDAIFAVAQSKSIPFVDTRGYIKNQHMTKDGFHYNTKTYGFAYCFNDSKNCDPPVDQIPDDLSNPTTGHGIRNVILREAIKKIESELDQNQRSIVISASSNATSTGLKPITLHGVQAQTAPVSIVSILQSYGSSGYLCYDFGGLSCVPATLSTIEGRGVRVDVTVDRSYPAKPICVSRTNTCNGGVFLDLNL